MLTPPYFDFPSRMFTTGAGPDVTPPPLPDVLSWTSITAESEWTPELVTGATGLAERLFEAGRLLEATEGNAALRAALIADGRWLTESVESRTDSPDSLTKLLRQRCDVCHGRFRDQ